MEPLFKHAVKIIDGAANSHATHPRIVPIYLKCTAGMRDLYSGDRDAILEETRRVLAASPSAGAESERARLEVCLTRA